MRKILLLCLIFFMFQSVTIGNDELLNSISFKLTIWQNNMEYEWEYHNPDEFEYEKGFTVMKNNSVKKEIIGWFGKLNVSETSNVEDMLAVVQQNGFKNVDKFEVRWMNNEEELFTWIWDKNMGEFK
jgi:hypothetical protein